MKLAKTDLSFINLYHQYFFKLKARLLKYYYLHHYQHVIDEDDIEQILFLSFHKLYQVYKKEKPNKIHDYSFQKDILKEAG
ncbi:hypothetical protein IKS57_03250 [bacterium]|nr:hypothetical protein [bacterium]